MLRFLTTRLHKLEKRETLTHARPAVVAVNSQALTVADRLGIFATAVSLVLARPRRVMASMDVAWGTGRPVDVVATRSCAPLGPGPNVVASGTPLAASS